MSMHPDLIAVPLLVSISSAIGTRREIQVKPGWREPAVLWAASIGDPGSGKSPARACGTRGPNQRQKELLEEYRREMALWRAKAEDEDSDEKPGPKPELQQIIVSDATVEALTDVLNANPRGLLCEMDELTALVGSFNAYKSGGQGRDRQTWILSGIAIRSRSTGGIERNR